MKCDICEHDLNDGEGYDHFAKELALLSPSRARERVEKIFGKFKFRICHVCYLLALGVKPLKSGSSKKSD